MSQDLRDVSPATGLVMGGFLLLGGLAVVFVAFDWIRVDPSSIHAPRWVLGVCGAMFALPGIAALYYGVRNGLAGGPSGSAPFPSAVPDNPKLSAAGCSASAP